MAIRLLFQFEIYSFPQEGGEEDAENSNRYCHGLLEMS